MATKKLSTLPLESRLPTPPQTHRGTTVLLATQLEQCYAPTGPNAAERRSQKYLLDSYTTHTLLLLETYRPIPPYHTLFPSSSRGTFISLIHPKYLDTPALPPHYSVNLTVL